jgi:hypothetical protein
MTRAPPGQHVQFSALDVDLQEVQSGQLRLGAQRVEGVDLDLDLHASGELAVRAQSVGVPGEEGTPGDQAVAAHGDAHRPLARFGAQDEYVFNALTAGVSGFLLKDARPEDLINGLHSVAAGDALLAPSVTRRLIDLFARGRGNERRQAEGRDDCSPTANVRCSCWSRKVSPTRRSRPP